MEGPCNSVKEALSFLESMESRVLDKDKENYQRTLNRFRYEARKTTGSRIKIRKKIKSYMHDEVLCGNCGISVAEPWFKFCPGCGYHIIRKEG